MVRISEALRQQVSERAHGRCEYCQTQQAIVVSMEVDHILPEALGGETTLDNLCYACVGCNAFKLDFQTSLDPETGQNVPLYNPRTEGWSDHFRWNDEGTLLIGLTATGRATVVRLRINRAAVVESRRIWVAAGWHPPR